jgi:hypothetical protein
MKKLFVFIIAVLFITSISFTGCISEAISVTREAVSSSLKQEKTNSETSGGSKNETSVETGERVEQDTAANGSSEEDIIENFASLIEEDKKPVELFEFINENITYVSGNTAAEMMEMLESHQKVFELKYTNILFENDAQNILAQSFSGDINIDDIDIVSDPKTAGLLSEIYAGGFKLINLEGSYYPVIDYELLKKYSDFLPTEYISYIYVMSEESNEVFTRDAGLVVSWDELADRLIESEMFLIDFPENTIRKKNISGLYMSYLNSYLLGQNNTPNRDYSTNRVYEEVLDSYRNIADKYPATQSGSIIKNFLKLLEENDYVISDDMFKIINDYLKRPVNIYDLDSPALLKYQVKNMYYTSDLSAYGYIMLVNGQYQEAYDVESATKLIISLPDDYISTGDLDGDDINDTSVILVADPGGSGTFYYLHAVINGYHFFYDAAADILGDRVKIERFNIEDNKIYLDIITHKQDDPMCCPTDEVSISYIYKDNRLFKIISHTGSVEEVTDTYIDVIIEDDSLIQVMLEGYELPAEIESGSRIYLEYYPDYIAEQNIIQNIEILEE